MPQDADPSKPQGLSFFEKLRHLFQDHEDDPREALMAAIKEAKEDGHLDEQTFSMVLGAISVAQTRVVDVMVPRAKIHGVDLSQPRHVWLQDVIDSGHSRLPVYEEELDEVRGILHAKDLLPLLLKPDLDVSTLLRPAHYVPESQPINVLLADFKATQNHCALVIDEYGAVSGLVTIEDILEEIVGEIDDEFDTEEVPEIIKDNHQESWRILAHTPIEHFNEFFNSDFEDELCETMGGLVTERLEHIPQAGERWTEKGFEFEVLKSDGRQATLLRVKKVEPVCEPPLE